MVSVKLFTLEDPAGLEKELNAWLEGILSEFPRSKIIDIKFGDNLVYSALVIYDFIK
jgi:hypothetical protein